MLTVSGAPIPRTTSHSVWPSATVPPATGGGAAAGSFAIAFAPAGAMPGHAPSALTRSSAVAGLSGVSGGASIEMLLMNRRCGRLNHSVSFERKSGVPEHPDTTGTSTRNARARVSRLLWSRTMNLARLQLGGTSNMLSQHHFAARSWLCQHCAGKSEDYH